MLSEAKTGVSATNQTFCRKMVSTVADSMLELLMVNAPAHLATTGTMTKKHVCSNVA